jgi:hypothetical protein
MGENCDGCSVMYSGEIEGEQKIEVGSSDLADNKSHRDRMIMTQSAQANKEPRDNEK